MCINHYRFINSDMGDSPSENLHDDVDSEVYPSEDGKSLFFVYMGFDTLMSFAVQNVNLLRQQCNLTSERGQRENLA